LVNQVPIAILDANGRRKIRWVSAASSERARDGLASLPEYARSPTSKLAQEDKEKASSEASGETGEPPQPCNPGTLLHPHGCKPCAFFCRQRCTNGDSCDFCHHSSHPRTRGKRRRKREQAEKEVEQEEKEGSSRASLCSTNDDLSSLLQPYCCTDPSCSSPNTPDPWSASASFVHPFPRGRSMAPP
jgi:hypothetical protein